MGQALQTCAIAADSMIILVHSCQQPRLFQAQHSRSSQHPAQIAGAGMYNRGVPLNQSPAETTLPAQAFARLSPEPRQIYVLSFRAFAPITKLV